MNAYLNEQALNAMVDKLLVDTDLLLEAKGGTKIPARRDVLCGASEHFRSMLSSEMTGHGVSEAVSGIVQLDASPEAVQLLVKCLHMPKNFAEAAQKVRARQRACGASPVCTRVTPRVAVDRTRCSP